MAQAEKAGDRRASERRYFPCRDRTVRLSVRPASLPALYALERPIKTRRFWQQEQIDATGTTNSDIIQSHGSAFSVTFSYESSRSVLIGFRISIDRIGAADCRYCSSRGEGHRRWSGSRFIFGWSCAG